MCVYRVKRKVSFLHENDIFQYGSSDDTAWPSSPENLASDSKLPHPKRCRHLSTSSEDSTQLQPSRVPLQGSYAVTISL